MAREPSIIFLLSSPLLAIPWGHHHSSPPTLNQKAIRKQRNPTTIEFNISIEL
jgi:hypothetical protein